MANIHRTALVDDKAELADDVEIGPYAIIGPKVKMGRGCKVGAYVEIKGNTTVGENNQFFHGCNIGEVPQDFSFKNPDGPIVIGNGNTFREMVTLHIPVRAGNATRVGNNNYFMNNTHLAHDMQVGNNVITVSNASFGGYVELHDHCYVSGLVGVHQFVKIGSYAIVSGLAKCPQDIPPFVIAEGHPACANGLNAIGMKRHGVGPEARKMIKAAYNILFNRKLPITKGVKVLEEELLAGLDKNSDEYKYVYMFVDFINKSDRGIISPQTSYRKG